MRTETTPFEMRNDHLELTVHVIGAPKAVSIADEDWVVEETGETLQCPTTPRRSTPVDTINVHRLHATAYLRASRP